MRDPQTTIADRIVRHRSALVKRHWVNQPATTHLCGQPDLSWMRSFYMVGRRDRPMVYVVVGPTCDHLVHGQHAVQQGCRLLACADYRWGCPYRRWPGPRRSRVRRTKSRNPVGLVRACHNYRCQRHLNHGVGSQEIATTEQTSLVAGLPRCMAIVVRAPTGTSPNRTWVPTICGAVMLILGLWQAESGDAWIKLWERWPP